MSGDAQDRQDGQDGQDGIDESLAEPDATAGGMGVRDTSPAPPPANPPPEQSTGGEEENPDGIPPKAGYPSHDPRSGDHPFEP